MKIPKSWKKITPLSKTLAMILFILLPLLGFLFGMKYQALIDLTKSTVTVPTTIITPTPKLPINLMKATCNSSKDCQLNEVCEPLGPIIVDPVTKKTFMRRNCVKKGGVVPL